MHALGYYTQQTTTRLVGHACTVIIHSTNKERVMLKHMMRAMGEYILNVQRR